MTIEGVLCEHRGIDHEDKRRVLYTMFNGDIDNFVARQIKFAQMREDATLGGHYHMYKELFFMLKGEAKFDLEDIHTKERLQFTLQERSRLFIPAQVAHKAFVLQGSILVGCTEQEYISATHNDIKYDF